MLIQHPDRLVKNSVWRRKELSADAAIKLLKRLLVNKLPAVYTLRAGYANDCAQPTRILSRVEG